MTPRIDVVGLGPGDAGLTTPATRTLIDTSAHRYIRTERHPSASVVNEAQSFDEFYEKFDTFADVYEAIVDRLTHEVRTHDRILYAVPGSPLVLERTVQLLTEVDDVEVVLHPAMSFLDVAWARLGIDPVDSGVQLVDGHRFNDVVVAPSGPLLVAHCHNQRVLSDIKLSIEEPGTEPVVVLQRLGTADETVFEVQWWDLDREVNADHLTSIYVPDPGRTPALALGRLADLVATLRRECPWDREQTHASLRRHLIEESYEVLEAIDALEAIDSADVDGLAGADALLCEELGDLMFQPLLHALIAAEEGRFGVTDIADGIHDKLVARHPHVFGESTAAPSTSELVVDWEAAKLVEKGRESIFDGIAAGLPALAMAAKVLRKANAIGVDTSVSGGPGVAAADLVRDVDAEAFGRLMMAVVATANRAGIDAEDAVRQAAIRTRNRLRNAEVSGLKTQDQSAFEL